MKDKDYAVNLRPRREDSGMSQAELARLSGVAQSRISQYENQNIPPSIPTLKALAGALGVNWYELL